MQKTSLFTLFFGLTFSIFHKEIITSHWRQTYLSMVTLQKIKFVKINHDKNDQKFGKLYIHTDSLIPYIKTQ